jgi:asparagine synthase (glutamine-hydrolysing)
MFAFAIWDNSRQRLLLARDRFGKKPLFFRLCDDNVLFSSEIKSFLSLTNYRCDFNDKVIGDYMVYRYVPGPDTLYKDIYKLDPGTLAVYEGGSLDHKRYYNPPDRYKRPGGRRKPGNAVANFVAVLREAVRLRMISDVPFGAFLSGGIDSSAIVALMTEFSAMPVKTFSVGFQESDYSELKYAKAVASHFGTEHHELTVSHEELIEHLPDLIRFRDAPVSEPSDIPIYLLSKEAGKTVKMVLTGEGSDEMLAGYPKHVFERYRQYYQWLPRIVRRNFVEPAIRALPYGFRRVKTAINTLGIESDLERQPRWFGAMSYEEAGKLLSEGASCSDTRGIRAPFDVDKDSSALRKILYFDQTSWLPDNLLERGDRMTMAASIEARMPFMDHGLAEYVSGLPDSFRVRGRTTKWLLRQAMKDMIPEHILNRPKVGFRLPVNEWFKGPMKDYLLDNLLGSDSLSKQYYTQKALEAILRDHIAGRQNHEKILWTMLNLEIWLKQYRARNSVTARRVELQLQS